MFFLIGAKNIHTHPFNGGMKMKQRFMKKPIVIEAFQTDKELIIQTLEGPIKASVGDWIITGIRGEQYPCKPDVFESTYQPVSNDTKLTSCL